MCQALFAQNTEEAFNQIHPGSMGGSVMERDEFVAFQPSVGGLVLMNVEIIRHDMKLLLRMGAHDLIHEAEKVYGSSSVSDVGYDLACSDFQSGDQRLSSVAYIFVGPTPRLIGA